MGRKLFWSGRWKPVKDLSLSKDNECGVAARIAGGLLNGNHGLPVLIPRSEACRMSVGTDIKSCVHIAVSQKRELGLPRTE